MGCASTCITTGPVFWARLPRSVCWLSASSSAKWAASWGEDNSVSKHHKPELRLSSGRYLHRYLSELCCVDGPVGAGHTTFPVVSILLSVKGNMSAIVAVFLSDGLLSVCHVFFLRELNCYPTCTTKRRIIAATRITQSCCRCWRPAVNPTHGQSLLKNVPKRKQSGYFPGLPRAECVCFSFFHAGLCLTGCIVVCFVMFMESSWFRLMRSISDVEVRQVPLLVI